METIGWTAVLTGVLFAVGGPSGGPGDRTPGFGQRDLAPAARQDPDDLRAYRERLETQQREDRKRLQAQQRQDRKQLRAAERTWDPNRRWDRLDGPAWGRPRFNPGWSVLAPGVETYRSSGYSGYTPVAPGGGRGVSVTMGAGGLLAPQGWGVSVGPAPVVPYRDEVEPPPPDPALAGVPAGSITELAGRLADQAEAFLIAFAPQSGRVPEGGRFLADATALRDAAVGFRQLAESGAPADQLALGFQEVAARWGRLDARMARVSGGRVGPNIATALEMGQTVTQIGQLMPVPAVGPLGP